MSNSTPADVHFPSGVVAIIEDDPLVGDGLRDMVQSRGWIAHDYPSSEAFLAALTPDSISCLVLDLRLPGMSGLELVSHLRREGHRFPILICSGAGDARTAVAAIKAGAAEFIQKPVHAPELLSALARSLEIGDDEVKAATLRSAAASRFESLTPRQHQVMDMILAGQPNKNIAADLGISQRTVENHRARLMRRTQSASLPELARLAVAAATPADQHPLRDHSRKAPHPASAQPARMTAPDPTAGPAQVATASPLGDLDADQFQRFFDAVPMAIIIAAMAEPEVIVYANPGFETLSGQCFKDIEGKSWASLRGVDVALPQRALGQALTDASDWVGAFELTPSPGHAVTADAYARVIVDEANHPAYRLAVLVASPSEAVSEEAELKEKIRERDVMIRAIQHRVNNNLQMITSLIRIESQTKARGGSSDPLGRLEGRINSIQIIYKLLAEFAQTDEIDLGVYLSEIASAVMHAHAVEGIHLDLQVDSYPVSVNVALPTGLVANELLTNALKHAFVGRERGTLSLHSLADATGWRVTVADDGVGLPDGLTWPQHGKLGELMVRSLRQNASADVQVQSAPGEGCKVTITFSSAAATPAAAL